MRVLLINPVVRKWAKPNCFPSGLGYLAETLIRAGHDVDVYDMNALRPAPEEFRKYVENSDYEIAGLGGIITIYSTMKELIGEIKEIHPDRPVMVGGSSATSAPHIMMSRTKADFLCIGEGEITTPELMNVLENGGDLSSVNGIWWRKPDGGYAVNKPRDVIKDLDSIPFPRWDLFPMEIYLNNPVGAVNVNKWVDGASSDESVPKSMNLISSRGCAYPCTFCYHDFMGSGFRYRSAENVYAEIVELKRRYDVGYFHFNDDCFITNRKNVLRFCDILIRENTGIEWGCSGRVNLMSEPLIAKMKEAGCVFIGYGIESGSRKVLDLMKKKVTVEQAREAILMTRKYLGWADSSFIVGMPGETRETIRETIEFCKSIDLKPEVVFFATPYPGTELYEIAMRDGKIKDEEEYLLSLGEQGEKVRINFTDFTDEELTNIKQEMVEGLGAWNKITHEE
ncbi:MAG TPA: radical SAM protein [bacterium]|nr:radical SAM protein [bacterium]